MNILHQGFAGLCWLVLLAGCGGEDIHRFVRFQRPGGEAPVSEVAGKRAMQSSALMARDVSVRPHPPAAEMATGERERMVIKTAQLGLEIADYEQWMPEVRQLVQQCGGYIVNASTEQVYENARRGTLVMRIPRTHFDSILVVLKAGARKQESEGLGGQDITEEFYDLKMRLENKEKTEKRFREILQSAEKVEDVLAVERELSRLREEIERLEGRKRYLKDRVRLGTITVNWHEPYPLGVGGQGTGFWQTIGKGFADGIKGFARVLRGLIALVIAVVPIVVFLSLIVWGTVRLVRWKRRNAML